MPVDAITKKRVAGLGWPDDDQEHAAKAVAEHKEGLDLLSSFAIGLIHGRAIPLAAEAVQKYGGEIVQSLLQLDNINLGDEDILSAAKAATETGWKETVGVLGIPFHAKDIPQAAKATKLWSRLPDGLVGLGQIQRMARRLRVDVMEEDIYYSALTLQTLGNDALERVYLSWQRSEDQWEHPARAARRRPRASRTRSGRARSRSSSPPRTGPSSA